MGPLFANCVIVLPKPSSSTATRMRPGFVLFASPTTMFRFCCVVLPAAFAGLPMIMTWYESVPTAFGPEQLTALPS